MVSVKERAEEIILDLHAKPIDGDKVVKDIPLNESNKHVRVEFYYDKGGMNYFTSSVERRGYYLSVSPIQKSANSVTYQGFSGIKRFLGEEVTRKSKKAHRNALKELTPDVFVELLDHIGIA